ncbi:MAG: radical SAM protein, partial [Clostridia bacterium]|nr:radical SAM protein [Clostridia bacterium]
IVYNTHGYENLDVLTELDKYVDVYLPDLKFFSPDVSFRYTGKKNYFDVAYNSIKFMAEKPLLLNSDGMIKSGTVVRHLVLPLNVTDSKKIIDALYEIKDKIYLNVMSQYTPFGEIDKFFELQRKLTKREYDTVIDYALSCGFTNLLYQKQVSADTEYIPKWDF